MRRSLRSWLPALLPILAVGCARPSTMPAPTIYTLNAPSDTVFNEVASLLIDWRLGIASSDRQLWILSTEEVRLGRDDEFLGKNPGYWADCGEELFISRAATADRFSIKVQVKLDPVDSARTSLRVLATFSVYQEEALGSPWAKCNSRGRFERQFVGQLEDRLDGR